jgi:hypothetical protein
MSTLKILAIAAVLAATLTSAQAETYNYACQVTGAQPNPLNAYLYSAKIDTAKKTVTWRGTVYTNAKRLDTVNGWDCAKWCFGNDKIAISTATQGVATLVVGAEEFECDAVRDR